MPDFDRDSKDLRKAVRGRFPNPDRIGCPASEIIDSLARHELSPDHPAAEHLVTCSPCYEQFLATRRQFRRTRSLQRAGIAVIVFGIIGGAIYLALSERTTRVFQFARAGIAYTLDLRNRSPNREASPGGQQSQSASPLVMPRKHLELTIYLPIGWQPGTYKIELLGVNLQPVLKRKGSAMFDEHVLTMKIDWDLSTVPSGEYSFAMKTGKNGWRTFAMTIH